MAYRVWFEGSNERQLFLFRNYDDAFNFASLAVDNGTYQDYHYMDDQKIEELPHHINVSIMEVDD